MKEIKINFVDFWRGFEPEKSFIYRFLSQYYKVTLAEKPDYLFFSCMGHEHLRHPECVRIYYTGENLVPDFNVCDYALGFHHINFEDRYLRFPLWLIHKDCWDELPRLAATWTPEALLAKRKFCNFVYSRSRVQTNPLREQFFRCLSEYKQVDSGGRYLNNIGGPVPDKLAFLADYKFTIAFENSQVSGYATEKVIDPMRVGSMPIYCGDPSIGVDFNTDAMVVIQNEAGVEAAIDEIVRLDNDDEAYLAKLAKPWFTSPDVPQIYAERLRRFFDGIFSQPLEQAHRTTLYGAAGTYQRDLLRTAPLATNYAFTKWCGLKDRIANIRNKK